MGPIVKGTALPVLVQEVRTRNAQTGSYIVSEEWQGPELAIRGLEQQYVNRNLNYRISNQGPIYSIFVETPEQVIDESLDRWEVFTESTEKSLFELPGAVSTADAYDALLDDDDLTFREQCEAATRKRHDAIEANVVASDIIRHLRAGVTGWQLDLVGLRRTRRVESYQATAGIYKLNLDTGLYVYSQAQLNLPPLVAFAVPATPSDISDLFTWGWRKRSQRVEIVGGWIEQTVELLLAPWSTLAYAPANGALVW